MATVMPVGGGGGSRVREREQGERRRERVRGRSGLRGVVRGVPGDEEEAGGGQGKQEVEARRCARVGTRRSPVGEEDDRGGGARRAGPPPGWAGLLLLGCAGEGRPGKPLLLLFIFFVF